MAKKLTLKLDETVINKAKKYAKTNKQSVSYLVETFLKSLSINEKSLPRKAPPIVDSLTGIIKKEHRSDFKKTYTEYLIEKYK